MIVLTFSIQNFHYMSNKPVVPSHMSGYSSSMLGPRPIVRDVFASNEEAVIKRKVFVKNISFDTTEETLRRHFEQFGELVEDGTIYYMCQVCVLVV